MARRLKRMGSGGPKGRIAKGKQLPAYIFVNNRFEGSTAEIARGVWLTTSRGRRSFAFSSL